MNYFDIIIIIVIIYFAYRGLKNGLIKELAGIISVFLGILFAFFFAKGFANILLNYNVSDSEYVEIIAFALILITVIILTFILSSMISKFIRFIGLGWLNKFAGLIFGTIKIVLILCAVFYLLNQLNNKFVDMNFNIIESSSLFEPIANLIEYFPIIKTNLSFKI